MSYPLRSLRRLRQQICRQREQGVAQALRELQRTEAALGAQQQLLLQQQRAAAARQQAQPGGAPTPVARLQQEWCYQLRLTRGVEQQQRAVGRAEAARERAASAHRAALAELARAEAQLKLVQRHEERWDAAQCRAALARAEAELEELVAARWGQR